jgi:hypothetical protein
MTGVVALLWPGLAGQLCVRVLVVAAVIVSARITPRPASGQSSPRGFTAVDAASALAIVVGIAMMYFVFVAEPSLPGRSIALASLTAVCAASSLLGDVLARRAGMRKTAG